MFQRVKKFLKEDIWKIQWETLSGIKKFGVKYLKILLFSFQKLFRDQLVLRAPALAFYSLLSVVPLMALAFGVAKGFGLQDVLQRQIQVQLSLPGDVETMILEFAQTTLQKAKGGLVAGLGLVFLFVAVTLVLSNIELSFNKIWGIKKGRTLSVKIKDYFSMIFVGTILLLISLSLTVAIANTSSVFGYLNKVITFLLNLIPYVIIWFLFAFFIMFMPNRRVSLKAGLVAGIISGTLYQLFFNFYIRLQVMVSVYNAIYGSLAALPLFLIWLQFSWISLLFGAEISYAYENVKTIDFRHALAPINIRAKKMILLRIVHFIVKNFKDPAASPPSAYMIANELGISGQLVNHLLEELVNNGLITETIHKKHEEIGYQPGLSPEALTVHKILKTMEEKGMTDIPIKDDSEFQNIKKILKEYDKILEKSSLNKKIEQLDTIDGKKS